MEFKLSPEAEATYQKFESFCERHRAKADNKAPPTAQSARAKVEALSNAKPAR